MNKFLIIIFISFIFNLNLQSQDFDSEDLKVIPPSPTAYELGKYGQIPVGYFTGTPNINIPLYNFKSRKLSVPISLSYNSNGIKVDQLASNVGLGWSLNAGGIITRIIKDEPDEETNIVFPENGIQELGVYSPMAMDFYENGIMEGVDTEADLFMFNFNGYSGKFAYDNNKKIVIMPYQNIKIIPFYNDDNDNGYTITTPDGIKYIFSYVERTKQFSQIPSREFNPPQITAWYLSKIIHPDEDQINFLYDTIGYSYTNSISQSHLKTTNYNYCAGGPSCPVFNEIKTRLNKSTIMGGKRIKEINSNNPANGKILFSWNKTHPDVTGYNLISNIIIQNNDDEIIESYIFDYINTYNNRVFLNKITYEDTSKQYKFEYNSPESLCQRNSYSQDYWGYFNNETNSWFVPKITNYHAFLYSPWYGNREPNHQYSKIGLLNKIIYPTSGYNEFEYEANTYSGYETIYPSPVNFDFELISCNDCFSTFDTSYTNQVEFDHDVFIHPHSSYYEGDGCIKEDGWEYKSVLYIYDDNGETISYSIYSSNQQQWNYAGEFPYHIEEDEFVELKTQFQEGHSYTIILRTLKPCTRASVQFDYYDQNFQVIQKDLETGGSRIKSISAFDPVTGLNNETYYYYNEIGKTDSSSGDAGNKGHYVSHRFIKLDCGYPAGYYIDCDYYVLNSSSLIPLINTGNNNIFYEYVTVSHGGPNFEQGAETHKFIINRDEVGYNLFQNGYVPTWSNTGWNNGLEESVKIYKNVDDELILTKQHTNIYSNDTLIRDTVYSYNFRKRYDNYTYETLSYVCKAEDTCKKWEVSTCTANHKHIWFMGGFFGSGTVCIAPGHQNTTYYVYHSCNGHSVGDTIVFIDKADNLSITEYKNFSFWHYLNSTSVIDYFDDGSQMNISTNYYYDNPEHASLTRVESTNSMNKPIKTTTTYPNDINDPEDVFMDQNVIDTMLARHMIAIPIKTEKFVDNNPINGQITSFDLDNNMILPSKKLLLEGGDYEIKVNFDEYDIHGNPIQYHKEDNIVVSYLWGYNYTSPIAKIENASFSQVELALGCEVEDLQALSDDELRSILNNLQEELPEAMITTYTYNPMIGITSATDPSGKTIYYYYDSFNRLETIRDQDSNVVKHIDYNYIQQ